MSNRKEIFSELIAGYSHQDYPAFHEWPNPQPAGILIPILPEKEWTIFLTQRTRELRDHAGEICFPGGKKEPHESLLDSAKREANEELGIKNTQLLGRISSVPLYTSNYRLVPFVSFIQEYPSQVNCDEVEILLPLCVEKLTTLPSIEGIPFHYEGQEYLSPIFDLHTLIENPPTIPIFGGTAIVLYEVLTLLCIINKRPPPKIIKGHRSWPLT